MPMQDDQKPPADANSRWRSLAEGIERLDPDARRQGRQLVAEAFAQIVVYRRGLRPDARAGDALDVLLVARSGVTRLLRIDKAGGWIAAEEADAPP